MTQPTTETQSLVIERELAQPPEKVWRALTEPHLIGEWLMAGDISPVVGHAFAFQSSWGTIDCRVVSADPPRTLSYTWASLGLDSVVTFSLSPSARGTLLRVEQVGFKPDQQQAYQGAKAGWPRFLDRLAAMSLQES